MSLAEIQNSIDFVCSSRFVVTDLQLRVIGKEDRVSQNGSPYSVLKLSDHSAECTCIVWWNRFQWTTLNIDYGNIYSFSGEFVELQHGWVLAPGCIRLVDPSNIEPATLFAHRWLLNDQNDLGQRFIAIFDSISNKRLKQLLVDVFLNPVIALGYASNQGSLRYHHNWQHGLMQHSLELAEQVVSESGLSKHECDTAIAVALLHDIGKAVTTSGTSRTELGNFQPHDMSALELLAEPLSRLDRHHVDVANQIRSFFKPKTWFPESCVRAIEQVRTLDRQSYL
jgi:hypothetical protein